MESIELILQEQNEITAEFNKIFQQVLHPPNPRAIRDLSWGRTSINVTVNLDEFDPGVLARLLPELTRIHQRHAESRAREIKAVQAVADALPNPALNLENMPMH